MSDGTKIEWADATLNYVNGCSVLSPGCTNCYAMKLAGTRLRNHPSRAGLTQPSKAGPVWTGAVRAHEPALLQALAWKRPRRIFWNAHGDLFHESVPDDWIDRLLAVCALTPQHTHMILTKRSARMRAYLAARKASKPIMVPIGDGTLEQHPFNNELQPPPNIWLGVSVEDQARADERVPDLLATPAAVRFISAEPLLGPVDLTALTLRTCTNKFDAFQGMTWATQPGQYGGKRIYSGGSRYGKLDWIIVGGESGISARPMHPDWARSLRDQCKRAGVAFHFKQWGEWVSVFDREAEDPDWRDCSRWQQTHPRGRWINLAGGHGFHGESVHYVARLGKKLAGRLLDGVEHNGLPA